MIGFAALAVARLSYFCWDDDEAVFVWTAKAVAEGHTLYHDVWFNYPPGFIYYLAAILRLAAPASQVAALEAARLGVLVWGLAGLAAVGAIAAVMGGRWAGLAALALLATAPHYVVLSSAVMTEAPAFALAAGSVWAALVYLRDGKWRWLIASGVLFSLSVCFKPTTAPTVLAPLLAIAWRERAWRPRLRAWAAWLVAAGLPVGLSVLFSQPLAFIQQFAGTYVESQAVFKTDYRENITDVWAYLVDDKYGLSHVSLVLLSVAGAVRHWRPRCAETGVLLAWLGALAASMLTHAPLYRHHLLGLLYPLAALGGVGLREVVVALRPARLRWRMLPWAALLVLAVIEARASAWASVFTVDEIEADTFDLGRQAVTWLEQNTSPGAMVLTDAHILPLRAERRVPIETINSSRMRIKTARLTDNVVRSAVVRRSPEAIILWEKKLQGLDDLATWVACRYELAQAWDERHRIYSTPLDTTIPAEATQVVAPFGAIHLAAYEVRGQVRAESELAITLYWEASSAPGQDYTVFVHLLDATGERIAQSDAQPMKGECPTSLWQSGEGYADRHTIEVTGIGAGGPYKLSVGLYFLETGERLPPGQVELALP